MDTPGSESTQICLIRSALAQSGRATVLVQGWSMYPVLQPGMKVTITKQSFSAVECGQVVAFSCGQRLIIHRVIDRTSKYLVTVGDNMSLIDSLTSSDLYIGTVICGQGAISKSAMHGRSSAFRASRYTCSALVAPLDVLTLVLPDGEGAATHIPNAFVRNFEISADKDCCIGISPAGVHPFQAFPKLVASGIGSGRRILLFVGFTFGPSGDAFDTRTLPPEILDYSVRLAEPWREFEVEAAIEEVLRQIDQLKLHSIAS